MLVQKQKDYLQNLGAKLSRKLPPLHEHVLRLSVPTALSMSLVGVVVGLQLTPVHTHIAAQKTADKKTVTHYIATPSKVVQPTALTPKATTTVPSSSPHPTTVPAKTLV